MANEEGEAHIWKQKVLCNVMFWRVTSNAVGVRFLEGNAMNGESPVQHSTGEA